MHQRIIPVNRATYDARVNRTPFAAPDPRQVIQDLYPARGFRSLRALAIAAGVPQPTLHRYVSGQTQDMDMANFRAIANALGVTVSELLGEVPLVGDKRISGVLKVMERLPDAGKDALVATANALAASLGDDPPTTQ